MSRLKFCPKCNNLLHPREDAEKKSLVFGCNTCDYEELAMDNVVYLKKIWEADSQVPVATSDSILPRTKSVRCARCKHREAVFFQAATVENEDQMTLYFVCCNPRCGHRWRDQ